MQFYPDIISACTLSEAKVIGDRTSRCSAFEGTRLIASGALLEVAEPTKAAVDRRGPAPVLIFDDATGREIEVDFRGEWGDVRERILALSPSSETAAAGGAGGERARETAGIAEPSESPRGPGRPRLGVVPREVTLLPRHWAWLGTQPGGASVALRKLVEAARRANEGLDLQRGARDATFRFITVLAGNLFGYEEATRALFDNDRVGFDQFSADWPADVRDFARKLASTALTSETAL